GEAALFAAQPGWLMTPRIWAPETGHLEKRKRPGRFDGHKTDRRSGAFCRTAGLAYDPENLGAGDWTQRKGSTR
ncbi:hypothetical protein ACTL32_16425, partial [Planococcus sp. FY231025]|uniref:hypothetical protein n=1 Tax=Planococcus sp. FY231025 TaxID=3455699 RepID=UPI003F903B44